MKIDGVSTVMAVRFLSGSPFNDIRSLFRTKLPAFKLSALWQHPGLHSMLANSGNELWLNHASIACRADGLVDGVFG
jgi:hypothetical protein